MKKKYRGILMQTDKLNRNGRIYPEEIFNKAVVEYSTKIKDKGAYGELGHPDTMDISLGNISHVINNILHKFPKVPRKKKKQMKKAGTYKRNLYVVDYEFLKTDKGNAAMKLSKSFDLVPSPRGIGSIDSNGVIQSDYKLMAIDLINSKDRA
jgi:hypothetical protein